MTGVRNCLKACDAPKFSHAAELKNQARANTLCNTQECAHCVKRYSSFFAILPSLSLNYLHPMETYEVNYVEYNDQTPNSS